MPMSNIWPGKVREGAQGSFASGVTPLEGVLEAIFDPVLVMSCVRDEHGAIVDMVYEYVNGPAQARLGIPQEELIGSRLLERFPSHIELGLWDKYRSVVETGERLVIEVPWFHEGNVVGAYEVSATPLGDGMMGITRDVTTRVVAAQRLKASERLYRFLADHAGDVAIMTNGGVIQWVSPSVTKVLGWEPDSLVGKAAEWLVHPDDLPATLADYDDAADRPARAVRSRARFRHGTGTWRWVDVTGRRAAVEDSELDGSWVFVFWDVDAEVRALAALEQAERERRMLEDRVQHAQRLDSLGVLAGGIAHDFNNLLVGVVGNTDLLRRQPDLSLDDRVALDQIAQAADQASQLTRQLLDYAGRRTADRQPVDVAAVVAQVRHLASTAVKTPPPILVDLPPDLPPVSADPGRLQQVVMNLIMNACQAAHATGGTVAVAGCAMTVSRVEALRWSPTGTLEAGSYVLIEVADTGPGMSDEVRRRLFEPFFTTKAEGRGLGLSVVHGIVTSLGGLIDVDSTPGIGTSMRVVLPAVVTERPDRTDQGDVASEPMTFAEHGHRVLVVDDKELVLSFVQRALSSRGLQVTVACDGRSALRTLDDDAGNGRADLSLAIVDACMPGMTLAELIEGLRRARPDLPVIVMSGYGHHDVHHLTAGIQGFLQKPFLLEELHASVAAILCDRR